MPQRLTLRAAIVAAVLAVPSQAFATHADDLSPHQVFPEFQRLANDLLHPERNMNYQQLAMAIDGVKDASEACLAGGDCSDRSIDGALEWQTGAAAMFQADIALLQSYVDRLGRMATESPGNDELKKQVEEAQQAIAAVHANAGQALRTAEELQRRIQTARTGAATEAERIADEAALDAEAAPAHGGRGPLSPEELEARRLREQAEAARAAAQRDATRLMQLAETQAALDAARAEADGAADRALIDIANERQRRLEEAAAAAAPRAPTFYPISDAELAHLDRLSDQVKTLGEMCAESVASGDPEHCQQMEQQINLLTRTLAGHETVMLEYGDDWVAEHANHPAAVAYLNKVQAAMRRAATARTAASEARRQAVEAAASEGDPRNGTYVPTESEVERARRLEEAARMQEEDVDDAARRIAEQRVETERRIREAEAEAARLRDAALADTQAANLDRILSGGSGSVDCGGGQALYGINTDGTRDTRSTLDCGEGGGTPGLTELIGTSGDLSEAPGHGVRAERGATLGDVAVQVRKQLGDRNIPLWGPGGLVDLIASVNGDMADPNQIGIDQAIVVPSLECLRAGLDARSAEAVRECQSKERVTGVGEGLEGAAGLAQAQFAANEAAVRAQEDLKARCDGGDSAACAEYDSLRDSGQLTSRLTDEQKQGILSDTLSRTNDLTGADEVTTGPKVTTAADVGEEYAALIEIANAKADSANLSDAQREALIQQMIREANNSAY